MLVATHKIGSVTFNRTFQVAVVGRILRNHGKREFSRGDDGHAREVIQKCLQPFFRPTMVFGNLGIPEYSTNLGQRRLRQDQIKLLSAPCMENLRRDAPRTNDRTHENICIKDHPHYPLRRVVVRTARSASCTSCSIISGLTFWLSWCTSSTAANNRSRRFCHSSSCHKGTTAAMAFPARSIIN